MLAALLAVFGAQAEVPVPPLQARVTDLTGTLNAGQRAALEARLAEFEKRKGSQVAVLLVPSTQPEAIEQYSIRVVDQWKLGRRHVDDGVLLLVAKNDRAVRIEVGRALEGPLPDAVASRIIRDHVTPRFREGDFYGGINAAIDRMIGIIDGEPLPAPGVDPEIGWTEVLVLMLFVGLFVAMILSVLALVFRAVRRGGRWASGRRTGGWSSGDGDFTDRGGGFGGGGFSSGGGSFGGGGGFSGGGGGFSGGGASGRW